jgi:Transglutaminase-like superfamily
LGCTHVGRALAIRIEVLVFAAVVPLLMRLRLTTLERILEPRRPARASSGQAREVAFHVEAALARGSRIFSTTCLTRALTRYYFLRRVGVPLTLCFGIGWPEGAPAAHCWLLQEGEPFLEARDPRPLFAETYRIPSPGSP